MLTKGATEVGKEFIEFINEAAADQLHSKKMAEQIEWLKKRLGKELKNGKKGAKLVARYTKKLDKILPAKKALARKTAGKALGKKVVGRAFLCVFLAQGLDEAWGKMVDEWNSSD